MQVVEKIKDYLYWRRLNYAASVAFPMFADAICTFQKPRRVVDITGDEEEEDDEELDEVDLAIEEVECQESNPDTKS